MMTRNESQIQKPAGSIPFDDFTFRDTFPYVGKPKPLEFLCENWQRGMKSTTSIRSGDAVGPAYEMSERVYHGKKKTQEFIFHKISDNMSCVRIKEQTLAWG